ncbi:MAG: hypothetical protein HY893_10170 [Deltaproteobacteria bacterium]|nr:hypothetical protein [Deltaproteobacteria bacterium]
MINLKEKYGDKIFNRKKSYRLAGYTGYMAGVVYSLFFALLIVKIFDIEWDYAVLKVFAIMLAFDFFREVMGWPLSRLHYEFFVKPVVAEEMRHYLNVLTSEGIKIDNHNSATYDDFLLFSSYAPTLSPDMKVLSAFNYGIVTGLYSVNPSMDGRYYNIWCGVVADYMKRNPDKFLRNY